MNSANDSGALLGTNAFRLEDPIRKILHELTDPTRQVKADIVFFEPLDEDGNGSFALIITGAKAQILAESVVGYLNTLAFRAEQKKQEDIGNYGVNNVQ